MSPANPLIIQSDLTILVEVDSPRYEEARICLGRFAELVKMPEHIHTYRLTALSVWNANASGFGVEELVASLESLAKYPLPSAVAPLLRETASRFGAVRLVRTGGEERLRLMVLRPGLADEFARLPDVARHLGARSANGDEFEVDPAWRGPLKRALVKHGWPVQDLAAKSCLLPNHACQILFAPNFVCFPR